MQDSRQFHLFLFIESQSMDSADGQSVCQISGWCFSAVQSMFSAMCECQALHPDPEDDDSDSDFEGEEYDLEEAGE